MNIQQLRYFISVVNYGTIREAAAKLFISESTISEQIKSCKKKLGLNLGITIIPEAFIYSMGLNENSKIKILTLDDFHIDSDICFIYKNKQFRPAYLTNFIRIFTETNSDLWKVSGNKALLANLTVRNSGFYLRELKSQL